MPRDANRKVVICDSSPLIFLAKLDGLRLIRLVLSGQPVALACVVREILNERAGPVEAERLRSWLTEVEVIDFHGSLFPSRALSQSDQSTLAWAVANKAGWLLADERLLRRFARDRGVRVIGFCGILLRAVRQGFLQPDQARSMLNSAVADHGLMISITLYRRVITDLTPDP